MRISDWSSDVCSSDLETEWIPALGVAWRVGVDGIALALALMTALLFLAAVAWPEETQGRARQYYAWFLFLEDASLGVLLKHDQQVFYIFFDLSMVSMDLDRKSTHLNSNHYSA